MNPPDWKPDSSPLVQEDFRHEFLVIHFWASWNGIDRTMNQELAEIRKTASPKIQFRSVDVGEPSHRELCIQAKILNVPSLAFYQFGEHKKTSTGLRSSKEITNWLTELSD